MRAVSVVAVLFLLCFLALLFAGPASCWAAPTITWYRVKHVTTLSTDMSGSSGKYWTQQIGARVRPGSPTEGLASVTVTVNGVAHRNCSNWWPANDGTGEMCFCTTWDTSALPTGGPYTLAACDQNAVSSEAVTTPALTRFAEPAPEVTSPPPGGVVTSTAPSIGWVQFLGFEGENAPPVASQGVGVSGDSGCLWRQCDLAPGETSAQYGGAEPLQPGQVYLARVWEFAPEVPLEGAAPGVYVEETGRVWAFVVYSPVPVIQNVSICRGRFVDAAGTEYFHEGEWVSAADFDGWQDISLTTVDPDGRTHPDPGDCGGSSNVGPYTLSQNWAQDGWPTPLGAGAYTITATGSHGSASVTTAWVSEVPPVQSITYPPNGSTIPETVPTFRWEAAPDAPGADHFCVCLEEIWPVASVLWSRSNVPGDATSVIYGGDPQLSPGHLYRLHVRAWYPDSDPSGQVSVAGLTERMSEFTVETVPNLWKFDFGPADSPRWPGFFGVTEADQYPVDPAAKPFGWTSDPDARPRFARDDNGPDDLCRDYVRGPCPGKCGPDDSLSFRVDVPNGDYVVYAIARWGHCCSLPAGSHQIWAEDALAVDVPMDAAEFYTTDYFYRGMDEDYPLRQPAWDTFVRTNFPEYSFTTTVTDGSLDLNFVACRVYAVIVYPLAYADEMAARIADIDEERRAQFDNAYPVQSPQELTFTPTPGDAERGYAAWPVAVMDPCHPGTLPPSPRSGFALSIAGALGERRAVSFAIRPLANVSNVSLKVSDLRDSKGHVIPKSHIEREYVRYLATPDVEEFGPGALTWKPQMLQSSFPINVPAQVTKQFWLTVHVPADAVAGAYTGSVTLNASSGRLTIPLTVQVWPFRLHQTDDMSYGLYYQSPDSTYGFSLFGMQDASDAMLRLDLQDMKRHGLNGLLFPHPAWADVDPVTGRVGTVDFSRLDRFLAGVNDTGFGGESLGLTDTMMCAGNCILANSSVTKFDTNFNAAFKDVLTRFAQWQRSRNVPLTVLLADEPRECPVNPWSPNFVDTMQYCNLANQVSGLTTTVDLMFDTCTGIDYTPIGDAIDELDTHPWVLSQHLISDAVAAKKPVHFYNTGGDLRFVYGFYQLKWPSDGAWEWHYDWTDGSVFDPFPYSPFNSQWHYTYPSPEGPVPTLKYEWASQGVTDYRYAATLADLSKKARKTGTRKLLAWADQADGLLQSIKDASPLYPIDAQYRSQHIGGIAEGPGCLTAVENLLETYRQQIAQMILALPPQMRDY